MKWLKKLVGGKKKPELSETQLQSVEEFAVMRVDSVVLRALEAACGASPSGKLEEDLALAVSASNRGLEDVAHLPEELIPVWHEVATQRFGSFFSLFSGKVPRESFVMLQEKAGQYYGRPLSHAIRVNANKQLPGYTSGETETEFDVVNREMSRLGNGEGPGMQMYVYQDFRWDVLPAATARIDAQEKSAPSVPPSPVDRDEFMETSGSDAWAMRQAILEQYPLRKCCEIPVSERTEVSASVDEILLEAMTESGLDGGTCGRLVLYRLDGEAFDEKQLHALTLAFVGSRASKDPRFLNLQMKFASLMAEQEETAKTKAAPVPLVGFSIKLDLPQDELIGICEVLATTEFMEPDADYMTLGSGFSANGVAYRIYSFWAR